MKFEMLRYALAPLVALATLAATAQEARADQLTIEFDAMSVRARDSSFDAIDEEDVYGNAALGIGYELGDALPGLQVLALYQSNIMEYQQGERLDSALQLDWKQRRVMAAADWGPMLFGFLRPSIRLGAGYSQQYMEMRTSEPTLYDRAHDFVGFGAVGLGAYVELGRSPSIPRDSFLGRLTLGAQTHLGYIGQTTATFDELSADPDALPEDDPWQRQPVDLGSLNSNGMFWNVGLALRVRL